MNPEDNTSIKSERLWSRAEERELLGKAYEKASKLDLDKIKMENFTEVIHPESIERDREYILRRKKEFANESQVEREAKALADIFEAILIEQIEINEWMGPSVDTRRASELDDIAHGVDAIAEITLEDSKEHLALAIDITYGKHLEKKFNDIKNEIEKGTLTNIRYFEEEDEGGNMVRGSKYKVPRVVVGIDKESLIELVELWNERKNSELAKHHVQLAVLDEIRMQLKRFHIYAQSLGNEEVADIYKKQLEIIEMMRSEKQDLYNEARPNQGYRMNDKTYRAILENAKKFDDYSAEAQRRTA